jgi:porphobilinogen deaminase
MQGLLVRINDSVTHLCLRAEREFLRLLNGDCDSPVGVQARMMGDRMQVRAQVFGEEEAPRMAMATGSSSEPEIIAGELMKKIYGD